MKYLINGQETFLAKFKIELKKAIKDDMDEENFADWVNAKYLPGGIDIGAGHYTAYAIISNDPDESTYNDALELYLNTMRIMYLREMEVDGMGFKIGHTRFEIIDEDYGKDVDLDDCRFKDSDYLEHLITTLENDIYNLAYSKSNSSEKRCFEDLYDDIQTLCNKSVQEVKNAANGKNSASANMSIANKLSDLSKHFENVSKKARTRSASIKILTLSETLLKCSKSISKTR